MYGRFFCFEKLGAPLCAELAQINEKSRYKKKVN